MALRYRYTRWDGSQDVADLDPDEVLAGLTDDLMNFGDLQHALRNLMQRGMRSPDGARTQGLRDLLQKLRQQRRQALDRFDLGSVFDDIQRQIDEIVDLERDTLDERLEEAGPAPETPSPPNGGSGDDAGSEGTEASASDGGANEGGAQEGGASEGGQPSGQSQPGGQPPPSGASQPDGGGSDPAAEFADMLRSIVERKQGFLDNLPDGAPGRMKSLQDYEFMNPEAAQKYQELMDSLRQQLMNSFFKDMAQSIQDMSAEDMDRMQDMIRDLNEMMRQRLEGQEPDFDGFMDKYGDLFGENPPQSLDELLERMQQQGAAMQNLMDSLPGDMRQQLQDMVADRLGDPGLQQELSQLASNLEALMPMRDMRNQYPFRGDEELDLQAAMNLMGDMQDMDQVERQLERTQYGGDLMRSTRTSWRSCWARRRARRWISCASS